MLDLAPSAQLELKPYLMRVEDICDRPGLPNLRSGSSPSVRRGFNLSFPTQSGISTKSSTTDSLDRAFDLVATLEETEDEGIRLHARPFPGFTWSSEIRSKPRQQRRQSGDFFRLAMQRHPDLLLPV